MPCGESSRKHLSSCRIRKCSATCAGRRKITIAGYQAWPKSRRGCGKITGSKEDPHGEERGTRVSNHEAPLDLILRDARKSALLRMRERSALLLVDYLHGRIHDHLDQTDGVMGQAAFQRSCEFG